MIDIRGDAKKIVVVLGGAHHNMGVFSVPIKVLSKIGCQADFLYKHSILKG